MKTTKVYSINHAVDIIFHDNLESKFEKCFGEIKDGECFDDLIKRENITLEQMVEFLNDNSTNEKFIIG